MLSVNHLSVSYGDLKAIEDISFEIKRQEIVSVIGSNGAGKTTILNTLSGILRPVAGTIELFGERIDRLPSNKIVAKGLVQIPEGRLLFPEMSVLDNLELGAFNRRGRERFVDNLEKVFNLFPLLKERVRQMAGSLSGGEQQMLAISRGLMAEPYLLMLDEPSLGLAPLVVEKIFGTIQEIKTYGITILLVEQNVLQSLSISTRGYVLQNGSIILEGEAAGLLENHHVKVAYLGL
jgi:branched-chain amino acid transport system ATP-binding protein